MYLVYLDGQLAYSTDMADESTVIESPKLSLEVNNAGTFDFVIYPTHYLYNSLHKMKTTVQVFWDDVEVFYGRVLEISESTYKDKKVSCEGALAFLNDSVQAPLAKNAKYTVSELVTDILAQHNEQTETEKHFEVGEITVGEAGKQYAFDRTSYENSRSAIEDIMESLDGYLRVRRENGTMYLDLLEDYDPVINQSIEFGVNLADISINNEADELFTAILPVGKNNKVISSGKGGPILTDNTLVGIYGKIVRAVDFDDISNEDELLAKGNEYLQKNGVNIPIRYEIKAVDLHYFNPSKDLILPGYTVPLISPPHGLDEDQLVCVSCELDIQNPENNSYVIGIPDPFGGSGSKGIANGSTTMTTSTVRNAKASEKKIDKTKLELGDVQVKADSLEANIGRIHATTEALGVQVFDQSNPNSLANMQQSTLWMKKDSITEATGKMNVDSSGDLHITDGTKLYLGTRSASMEVITAEKVTAKFIADKVNGGTAGIMANHVLMQAGSDIISIVDDSNPNSLTKRLGTIEGTSVIQHSEDISLVAGKFRIDSNNNLVVTDGAQLYVDTIKGTMAVYDAGNLTASVVVDKINGGTATIEGNHINLTANSSFNLKVGKNEVISSINASTEGVTISGDKVDLTANTEFNLKVGKGEIASSINATAQSVKISASKINLAGYVTAEDLSATNAKINNVLSGTTAATHLHTAAFTVTGSSFSLGGSAYTSATRRYVSSLTTKTVSIQDSVTGQVTTFKAVDSFTTSGATFLVRLNS